jgi:glycerol uptake facilitator-like aquaporin
MAVILAVAYSKGLRGFGGIVFGTMVGLDIFFLAFVSWASMNSARSLAPALLPGGMLRNYGYTGPPHLLEHPNLNDI